MDCLSNPLFPAIGRFGCTGGNGRHRRLHHPTFFPPLRRWIGFPGLSGFPGLRDLSMTGDHLFQHLPLFLHSYERCSVPRPEVIWVKPFCQLTIATFAGKDGCDAVEVHR